MLIRSKVALMFGVAAAAVAGLGVYGLGRVLPRARAVRDQTEVLRQLHTTMARNEASLRNGWRLAHDAVATRRPAALADLRRALAQADMLAGTLPLANTPPAIRVPGARAADQAARMGAALEEIASLLELGRRDAARSLLARADSLQEAHLRSSEEVRVRALDNLLLAQARATRLGREMVIAYVVWLMVTIAWVVVSLGLMRRQFFVPLRLLRGGLRQVEEGDLAVTLPVDNRDEMGELTEHFNTMTKVLRDRATRQGQIAAAGELLAGAAHEVNNPLMAIAATAETRRHDAALSAAVRADLESIGAEAHRAGHLVRAIVAFLRPPDGTVSLENPNDLVRDTWDLLWPQLRADGVSGSLDLAPDLPPVRGQRQRLQQMLVNVLSNAHQAVMQGPGPRRIDVRAVATGGDVVVEIRDNGGGVAPEALSGLFKPFFTTRSDRHVGLGLYVSRLIAREHGGDVRHEARDGSGATFVIRLPAAPRRALAPSAPAVAGQQSLRGQRILVVEDEASVRRPIARYLARLGAEVLEAADGREALGIALERPLDVVLTDLRMPGMDGITLYHELQARDSALADKVIFLSGDVAQLTAIGTIEVPADRVLTKPIELAELERRILGRRSGPLPQPRPAD